MAVNTQFSIAVHLMAGLAYRGDRDTTSAHLARSVNTSPSFVRRVLSKLSKAGLVETTTGKGGRCRLAREPGRITLLDIHRAVDAPKVFAIHTYSEQKVCPVSCHIKAALEKALARIQAATDASLAKISLAQILAEVAEN